MLRNLSSVVSPKSWGRQNVCFSANNNYFVWDTVSHSKNDNMF